jgi:hypothetical protein
MIQTIQIETEIETDGVYCAEECMGDPNSVSFCTYFKSDLDVTADGYGCYYSYRCQKCLDAKVVK